ncbi:MAG: HAMP domain-containing histidine kinase [Ruminococcus sp.]|nr:HAMP domain-containing histidine kinase [Ruminococcus sp.]
MQTAIKRLRRNIILLSFATACTIILIMLVILNGLMRSSYTHRIDAAAELIAQTADRKAKDVQSESIDLASLTLDGAGDYVVLRNPMDVESITIRGTISCSNPAANWFSAGGGIVVKTYTADGTEVYFYQEYSFNNNVSEITIDFPTPERFHSAGHGIPFSETTIAEDVFMISQKWWASSSENEGSADETVSLSLESITINYKENTPLSAYTGGLVSRSYDEIFDSSIPESVSSLRSFFLVTNPDGTLLEINSGNLPERIPEDEAGRMASKGSDLTYESTDYECRHFEKEDMEILVFVSSAERQDSLNRLMLYSACIGIGTALLLFVMIYLASGKIVEHVSVSYEKQNQFIANASHELKTPITVISATTDILLRRQQDDQWLGTIKGQTEKMQKLLQEMLQLTQMNAVIGKPQNFERFDLCEIAEKVTLYFEARFYEVQKVLVSEFPERLMFYGDAGRIEELFNILLDNAVKYADERAIVRLQIASNKNSVTLSCTNPCSKFDEAQASHLFERFYRSDTAHSDETEGFGLGLTIAQLIAEQHGGTISVSYDHGEATFQIVLPIKGT